MINETNPLSLAEAKEIVENTEDMEDSEEEYKEEAKKYLKKFSSMDAEKAKEMRKELEELEIFRLKEQYIAKVIDILPEDASDINKISPDLNLDEEDTNKILKVVEKYK